MTPPRMVECSFLIPIYRDTQLSDGEPHTIEAWYWLKDRLWDAFRGATIAPGLYHGFYEDPDSGDQIQDKSRKYIIALTDDAASLDLLRDLLCDACSVFHQKMIYLSISGRVEFIRGANHDTS